MFRGKHGLGTSDSSKEEENMKSAWVKHRMEQDFWKTKSKIQDMLEDGRDDVLQDLIKTAKSEPCLCLHVQHELERYLEQYKWAHPRAIRIVQAISEIHVLITQNIDREILQEFHKYKEFPEIMIELLCSVWSGFYSSTRFESVVVDGMSYNSRIQAHKHFYAEKLISNGILEYVLGIIGEHNSQEMLYRFMNTIRHCTECVSVQRIKECFNPDWIMIIQKVLGTVRKQKFRFIDHLNDDFGNLMCLLFQEGSNYPVVYEIVICQNLLNQLGNDDFTVMTTVDSLLYLICMNTKKDCLVALRRPLRLFSGTDLGKFKSESVHNILSRCMNLDKGKYALR